MRRTSVLIVEDEGLQRRTLESRLRWLKFEVAGAESVEEARRLADGHNEPFDVVVLDMHLGEGEITGAQLGAELMQRPSWRKRRPEFLINSALSWTDYYEHALKLGVAAYLKKDSFDIQDVVHHIKVLALRRSLGFERPEVLRRIQEIAILSCDETEAVKRFCTDFICTMLRDSLGHPFLVLLTLGTHTECICDRPDLPQEGSAYSALQALTFGETGHSGSFDFDSNNLRSRGAYSPTDIEIFEFLDGASFVPLASDRHVKLSVGILPSHPGKEESIKEARALAQLLGELFRPAVLEGLLKVVAAFAQLEQRREEVARATAQFCLYVGQEQLASLDAAEDSGELAARGQYIGRLRDLAEDLTRSGSLLGELVSRRLGETVRLESSSESGAGRSLEMKEVVLRAWEQAGTAIPKSLQEILGVSGSCLVRGSKEYLHLAVTLILQWFVLRAAQTPAEEGAAIKAQCVEAPDGPRVIFRDRSRKLPQRLREQLFAPVARGVFQPNLGADFKVPGLHLSLYLAKMLVELGNGGLLLDNSAELKGDRGHELIMRFPLVRSPLAA